MPLHIVQRILGHASLGMIDIYAHLYDTTIHEAFDRYQQQRVDIAGGLLDYDPESPAADAECLKHNLAWVQASLPDGYCGAATPAGMPPPQRLPNLPPVPNHGRVSAHPPPARLTHPSS